MEVTGVPLSTKTGQRFTLDGEDLGRVIEFEYDQARGTRAVLAPELLYWHMVLRGNLTGRMLPGHEPAVPVGICPFCAGGGRLANLFGGRIEIIDCHGCEGMGWVPRARSIEELLEPLRWVPFVCER